MKKTLREQDYRDSIEKQDELINAYYCISDGLLVLSNLYRNAHLNFDGNHLVDQDFENWMNDTFGAHFTVLHRIRIVTSTEEKILPFFGLNSTDSYCPIRAYVEKFFSNDGQMGIANNLPELIDFLASVETEFLNMTLELYNTIVKDADPSGENEVQGYIDASEKRLLDISGIIDGLIR